VKVHKLAKKHYAEEVFAKQRELQAKLDRHASKPIYNIVPLKAISPLASPSSLECEKGK
jgi:hypothetical protein